MGGAAVTEIVDGIYRIEQLLGSRYLYLYLVAGARCLLVDTGVAATPDEVVVPALERLGVPAERVGWALVTHADVDHFGGNASIKRLAPAVELVAHAADQPWIESRARILAERYGWYAEHGLDYAPEAKAWLGENMGPDTPLDRTVAGGEWLDLGGRSVRVLHLPGHSPGHLGVWDPQTRTAIIGDAILERGLYDVHGNRISPPPYFDAQAYLSSIAQLEALAPEHLLTAHYPAMGGREAAAFLAESRQFVGETAQAVEHALRRSPEPMALAGLTTAVEGVVGPFTSFGNELAGPVRAHADELVGAGRVVRVAGGRGVPAWRWVGER